MPASARSTPASPRSAASTTTPRPCAIVTALERRYPQFDGLNLTWETLEGLVKHNGPLTDREGRPLGRYRGHGVPATILDYVAAARICNYGVLPGLEAQIAAFADDIAYDAHDIDDGLRAGLFRHRRHRRGAAARQIIGEIDAAYPGLERQRLVHELVRRLIGFLIEDVDCRDRARALPRRPALGRRRAAARAGRSSAFPTRDARQAKRAIKALPHAAHVSPSAGHAGDGPRRPASCATCSRATARIRATAGGVGGEGLDRARGRPRARGASPIISPA